MQAQRFKYKGLLIFLVMLLVVLSVFIIVLKPKMHKVVQFSVIETILKFNSDGSITTTKQITRDVIKEK